MSVPALGCSVNPGSSLLLPWPWLVCLKFLLTESWALHSERGLRIHGSAPPTTNGKVETQSLNQWREDVACTPGDAPGMPGRKGCPWGTSLARSLFQIHLTGEPAELFLSKAPGQSFKKIK